MHSHPPTKVNKPKAKMNIRSAAANHRNTLNSKRAMVESGQADPRAAKIFSLSSWKPRVTRSL